MFLKKISSVARKKDKIIITVLPSSKQCRIRTFNVTPRRVRVMFVPPRLSQQFDTVRLEERHFTAI